MTIVFRGTAESLGIVGNDATTQNLFVIENGYKSRVNVIVRHLTFGCDSLAALTTVQNMVRISRCTAVSGGVTLVKAPFVTTETSDSNVVIRAQANETALITATAGDTLWAQMAGRMHTAVEQQQPEVDSERTRFRSLLPNTEHTFLDFVIRPGEALLVKVFANTAASNAQTSTNWAIRCMWEEDSITTFAISGTVTLSGSPLDGAKVMVVEADDTSLTNAHLYEVKTTAGGGLWSSTIRTGKVGAAFVQYENGGTYYTAPGSPFLQQ
jgi:hypothetical protein